MDNSLTSDLVRKRIKNAGYTMEEAATKLGMVPQNLYKHLKNDPLSLHFTRLFNEHFPEVSTKVDKVDIVEEEGIPYYPLDVTASNTNVFTDSPEVPTMKISIPGFEDCELALPVFGHSMYPTYENGCIIICKRIHDMDVINYGEVYLVVTKEQRLLKRIRKSEERGSLLLVSDNYEAQKEGKARYEPFDLPKSKIQRLYIVKGSIRRNQI